MRKMRFAHGMNEMRQTQAHAHIHAAKEKERQKEKAQHIEMKTVASD